MEVIWRNQIKNTGEERFAKITTGRKRKQWKGFEDRAEKEENEKKIACTMYMYMQIDLLTKYAQFYWSLVYMY